jgi:hypothetical protein
MRRGFTYAGGKRRTMVTNRTTVTCERCDGTIRLEYRTDAVNAREAALDRYRALRAAGWYPQISPDQFVTALCPIHGYEDMYGH